MPKDVELVERYRPEAASELEQEWMDKIDPIEFSIYSTKIELICQHAKQILVKTSVAASSQAGDCVAGIYTAEGDLALASVGTYLHATTGQIPVKYAVKHFTNDPTVGVKEGDVFFVNEAVYGGIHNCDQINFTPIFYEGQLIAWAAAATHEEETGAIEPGGMPMAAKTRYDEGIKIPPIKVGEGFKLKTDLLDMINNGVRNPRMIGNDLKSRTAAAFKMRERFLEEVVKEKGVGFAVGMLRKSVEVAEEGARMKIQDLNDGTYRHTVFFDTMGYTEALARICIEMKKKGDTIEIDFSGSSPQTPSSFNCFTHQLRANLSGFLCQYLFSDLPASTGIFAPFTLTAPVGSCVNADPEAAISNGVMLGSMMVNGLSIAFLKAMFDSNSKEYVALPEGAGARTIGHGNINQYGKFVTGLFPTVFNANGAGARCNRDGIDAAGFWWQGWGDCLDIELDEVQEPLLYMFRNVPKDQGGLGKYRGGAGAAIGSVVHNTSLLQGASIMTSSRFPVDMGLFGGYAGYFAPYLEIKDSNLQAKLSNTDADLPFEIQEIITERAIDGTYELTPFVDPNPHKHGDFWCWSSPSGGGYGDVLDRDPDSVIKDLKDVTISEWTAKNVYHVAYDENTMRVDYELTNKQREEERQKRIQRGKTWDEFNREWLKKRPADYILKYFGEWPTQA